MYYTIIKMHLNSTSSENDVLLFDIFQFIKSWYAFSYCFFDFSGNKLLEMSFAALEISGDVLSKLVSLIFLNIINNIEQKWRDTTRVVNSNKTYVLFLNYAEKRVHHTVLFLKGVA